MNSYYLEDSLPTISNDWGSTFPRLCWNFVKYEVRGHLLMIALRAEKSELPALEVAFIYVGIVAIELKQIVFFTWDSGNRQGKDLLKYLGWIITLRLNNDDSIIVSLGIHSFILSNELKVSLIILDINDLILKIFGGLTMSAQMNLEWVFAGNRVFLFVG